MYELDDYFKELLSKTDKNNIKFFVRAYYDEEMKGLGQLGSTSDKFTLNNGFSSADECSETEAMPFLSKKELDIVAEIENDGELCCEVVGHIHGYIIDQYELFEDMDGVKHSFIVFDGISQILCEFWHMINKFRNLHNGIGVQSQDSYSRGSIDSLKGLKAKSSYINNVIKKKSGLDCLRLINEYQTYMYFATNIDLVEELYSPQMEDLILSLLIPNFFSINNFPIYNVIKTIGATEISDNFATLLFSETYNHKEHIDTMVNELDYKVIKDDECTLQLLSKKIMYDFFEV